ncbi:MAG: ATP-binding protein, partial [Pseudomonadota bacterium]
FGDTGTVVLHIDDRTPEELLDQVLIPFFTTRRGGSGIGLSLSRQIMSSHGGDVIVERLTVGTRVRLVFV